MSRIGKLPIPVPAGVTVTVDEHNMVVVKGPKGTLSQQVNPDIKISQEQGELLLERPTDNKPHKSMHGLYRSLLNNMVVGVTTGFERNLELVGTGYRAQVDGKKLTLSVGYSHPIVFEAPQDVTFETPAPTQVVVKGIKYKGEHIRRKEGKSGK